MNKEKFVLDTFALLQQTLERSLQEPSNASLDEQIHVLVNALVHIGPDAILLIAKHGKDWPALEPILDEVVSLINEIEKGIIPLISPLEKGTPQGARDLMEIIATHYRQKDRMVVGRLVFELIDYGDAGFQALADAKASIKYEDLKLLFEDMHSLFSVYRPRKDADNAPALRNVQPAAPLNENHRLALRIIVRNNDPFATVFQPKRAPDAKPFIIFMN